MSMSSYAQLTRTSRALERALERLSTGRRVNSARDGTADFAQSERMRSEIRGYAQASLNINSSVGQLQTTDSVLQSQMDLTQRMRELAVQASNGVVTNTERDNLNQEFQSLLSEFNRISGDAEIGGTTLQIGPDKDHKMDFDALSSTANDIFREDYWLETFELQETSASFGAGVRDILYDDLNGDGIDDLLYTARNAIVVRFGNGDGTFQANQSYDLGGLFLNSGDSADLVDIDEDGDLDLIATGSSNDQIFVRLNNGSGVFTVASTIQVSGTAPRSLSTGDVNGDGNLDIAFSVGVAGGGVVIRYGDGTGNFNSPTTVSYGGVAQILQSKLADVDGDGDLDLVSSDSISNQIIIKTNDGGGAFTHSQSINNPEIGATFFGVDVGDFDGDGDVDLLSTPYGGQFIMWKNEGGTFTAGSSVAALTSVSGRVIDVFDYDNDGDLDFSSTGDIANQHIRFLNDGNGNFTGRGTISTGTNDAFANLTRDLNSDGFADLILVDGTLNTAAIHIAKTSDRRAQDFNLTSADSATKALDVLDRALRELSDRRSQVGTVMNRLEFTSASALLMQDNLEEARSRLADADIVSETSELVRLQILQQAQVAVMAQANVSMRIVLELLPK